MPNDSQVNGALLRCVAALAFALACPVPSAAAPGDLDPTFGVGGIVVTPIGSGDDAALALVQQSDGKLVAAGYALTGTNADIAVVRYTANGALDPTFGTGGRVTTPVGSANDVALAVALQSDGKLVVAGYTLGATTTDIAVVRYNANGTLDGSFGTGGKVVTGIGASNDVAFAVTQQTDGKLVVAGYTVGTNLDVAVVRYNANGSLDTTFGTGGKVVTAVGTSNELANAIVQQPDGKLVAAGYTIVGSASDVLLVRYQSNGALDSTFGSGGKVVTPIGTGNDIANALVQLPGGQLVIAGSATLDTMDVALARYNSDGSLDPDFGVGGKVVTAIGTGEDAAKAVALQAGGKIVAAGYTVGATTDVAVLQYLPDGTPDPTFGVGGQVVTPISTAADVANGLIQRSDGKLVVAGSAAGTTVDFALVRYDTSFICGDSIVGPGEQCDDGNSTSGDCCSSTCQYELAGSPCNDGNPCTTDLCNGAGLCTTSNNTAPCDDGIFCNGTDTCSAGSCAIHTGDPCPGADRDADCAESCNETADACTAADPDGSTCADDGDVCTTDACSAGTCGHMPIAGCETTTSTSTSSTTTTSASTSTSTTPSSSSSTSTSTSTSIVAGTTSTTSSTSTSTSVPGGPTSTSTTSTTTSSNTSTTSSTTLPQGPCTPSPRTDCLLPVLPGKAKLLLKRSLTQSRNLVSWTWGAGAATSVEEFGDPTTTEAYALCLYAAEAPIFSASVAPGGLCGTVPCWKPSRIGYKYRNKVGIPAGITTLSLKSGAVGFAKVSAKGKGAHLVMPPVGDLQLPVRVQLQAAWCWEARYGRAIADDGVVFKALSD